MLALKDKSHCPVYSGKTIKQVDCCKIHPETDASYLSLRHPSVADDGHHQLSPKKMCAGQHRLLCQSFNREKRYNRACCVSPLSYSTSVNAPVHAEEEGNIFCSLLRVSMCHTPCAPLPCCQATCSPSQCVAHGEHCSTLVWTRVRPPRAWRHNGSDAGLPYAAAVWKACTAASMQASKNMGDSRGYLKLERL